MIVLLHGFTGSPRSFEALRGALEGEHGQRRLPRLLVPPLLGHGARAPFVTSFDDEVDRLARRIDEAADGEPCTVVGYSLGGRLALALAARYHDLVARVVAIGAHPGLSDTSARVTRLRADEALAARIVSGDIRGFVSEWEALPLFASQRALPATVLAAQRAIRLSHDPAGLARSLRTVGLAQMPDLRSPLRATPAMIHLVTGALDDRFTSVAAALRPDAHTIVPDVGHNVLLEAPEAVASIVRDVASAPRRDLPFEARP